MRIGIKGTGTVGTTLGSRLVERAMKSGWALGSHPTRRQPRGPRRRDPRHPSARLPIPHASLNS
jgi:hypothetical protein